jgi:hypothetical protein
MHETGMIPRDSAQDDVMDKFAKLSVEGLHKKPKLDFDFDSFAPV